MVPTPYTLGVKRRAVGAKNARNNPAVTYAAATSWKVHGYAPGANVQPEQANRDLSLILWTVYAPANDATAPTELDRVVLEGDEYDVVARPGDWSNGPWPFPDAGIVVELKKADG